MKVCSLPVVKFYLDAAVAFADIAYHCNMLPKFLSPNIPILIHIGNIFKKIHLK